MSDGENAVRRSAVIGADIASRLLAGQVAALSDLEGRIADWSDAEIRAAGQVLHQDLRRLLRTTPGTVSATLVDAHGVALVSSDTIPSGDAASRDGPAGSAERRAVLTTAPALPAILSRHGEVLTLSLARRVTGAGPGRVALSIAAGPLAESLVRVLADPGDRIALVDPAGGVILDATATRDRDAPAIEGTGNPPEAEVLSAMQPLPGVALQVLATRPRASLRAAWRNRMAWPAAFGLGASALALFGRRWRRDRQRLATLNEGLRRELRQGADRLRRAEEIGMIGTFEYDTRSGRNIRSPEYMAVHGMASVETLERHEDWVRRLHPDDRAAAEAHILAVLADPGQDQYSQTYRIVTPAGDVRWIMSRGRIQRDAEGRALVLDGAHLDVSQLRATELALADSDARLRLAQEAVGIGTWEWVPSTRTLSCSRKMLELWGMAQRCEPPVIEDILAAVDVEGRLVLQALMQECPPGAPFRNEFRIHRTGSNGGRETVWMGVRATLLEADARAPARVIGVAYDITERKRSDEMTVIMAHEVEHRAKNVLMIVSGLLRMTKVETAQQLVEVMDGRVRALSRTMGLLGQGRWRGAALEEIVHSEVGYLDRAEPGGARAIDLAGPSVTLAVDAAQPFAMALHELATNAAKYGSLSVAAGRLSVRWWIEDEMLQLRWTERGGPKLEGAPGHRGFGSHLITTLIEGQLRGSVSKSWEAEGLVCAIAFPLAPP